MKTRLLTVVLTFAAITVSLAAGPRATLWKQFEEAQQAGLPKTAMERLEPIIAGAIADKAYAEAIKAIVEKLAFEGEIQGGKAEEKIARLEVELTKVPAAMKPVMETVLAHWYWQYFQQNRWRFLQRTQAGTAAGDAIETWDLARILTEIDRHFAAALANDAVLKKTPIREYDGLLERGTVADSYRPTLFDFLANEALQFYQAGEQAAASAEDEFEIDAANPIFDDAAAFMAWNIDPAAGDSPKAKALRIYQSLLTFHDQDRDRSAFFDADLARLTYGHNVAIGETKDARYAAALERLVKRSERHEIFARVVATLATHRQAAGDLLEAHRLAKRGFAAYPKSTGGALCFNLVQQLEAPSARLQTEQVWNAPWPTLDVTYRNVTKVYFRAYRLDFVEHITRSRWNLGGIELKSIQQQLAGPPELAWDAELPATKDFKERTEKLAAPAKLAAGFYYIVASHDPAFDDTDNQMSVASVWVSNLAVILEQRNGSAAQAGFVLDARSGDPVPAARIRIWQRDREGRLRPVAPTLTDANGRFTFSTGERSVVVLAEDRGQAVSSSHDVYAQGDRARESTESQTVFFTDRAIYRPGQTINYKGISIRYQRDAAKYAAIEGYAVVVVFKDPNGQEIARASHVTNDYGSFSGVFTAPRDRVMGRMSIQLLDRPGATTVRVEEYKRPKFQVGLKPAIEAAKLGAEVSVTGHATAYTGAAVGGAKVKWHVQREVQLPSWCWWWRPPAAKAIAHGTAVTDADGRFTIRFRAEPDHAVPEKNEPVFVFDVHADVTDTTGETRSDERAIRAGYTALQASLTAEEWQTPDQPVELTIGTSSLDGDPQPAEGSLVVHALKQPAGVARQPLQSQRYWYDGIGDSAPDPANPDSWELGAVMAERAFQADAGGKAQVKVTLGAGIYRASLTTKDRFGKNVTARRTIEVVAPAEARYGVKVPDHFSSPNWTIEPGKVFTALWGTGYEQGRAFVEVESNGKILKSYWTPANRTQALIELPVTESLRGGFTVRVGSVHENRAYLHARVVDVPWSNQELTIKWERFRSKLLPGEKETWTAVISGHDAKKASAEMVAALYDASLDQYVPHDWPRGFGVFRTEFNPVNAELQNHAAHFQTISGWAETESREVEWTYRSFPHEIIDWRGDVVVLSPFMVSRPRTASGRPMATLAGSRMKTESMDMAYMAAPPAAVAMQVPDVHNIDAESPGSESGAATKPDLSKVTARTNLNETAFFFPQLLADENGVVKMQFTMPEALTEWKFLGFAHDAQLRSGLLTAKVVTAKDLMVEPNPPRFVREGDELEFVVKVSNQSDEVKSGSVRLTFADAATQQSVDAALANQVTDQQFEIPPRQSRTYSWRIAIPDGAGVLTYKAVAAAAELSDGEEGFLPVLSRRILVTESLPLPIRGQGTKAFEFTKLIESGASGTLRHQSLTVQMTSQPAWYAVMALPYLMEFPHECSEQTFNRFYANALARHIANSDPKIRRVFDLWKNTPALDSPLEKNQELKAVMIEETPWLRQAKAESQARKNVGLLFDANRLDEETARVLRKLAEQQLADGLWSWFPGGRPSEYISLYITTGFGRLRHLGADVEVAPAIKSLAALDAWMDREYREILKAPQPDAYVPSYSDALYLYGRSFFLKERPIAKEQRAAVDFFLKQARVAWVKLNSRQSQAHLALALQRFGDQQTATAIVASLKERSVTTDELGMFWRDTELSWWWYHAPIETQALMIEAFAEVTADLRAVDDCQVWLLKQKQTQDWRTTKATADAIYGLLIRGPNLLASDARVDVSLGGELIKPENVEAGTGFYEKRFAGSELRPAMGNVSVTKVDEGVSWGSVHWQYLEDIGKITPHDGTPLRLKKTLWLKETTAQGAVLKPVRGAIAVGDELVVRIELRTDRDMEFVHLKDQRGSGTEPVNVLSRYRYQDGLAYYESTRDTASHFFIDYLPKGTYVFEYSTRVQLRGRYQSGLAEIQCMYAPEFNSHSESMLLEVK